MKQKFNIITSTCVPLPLENVDTDQIIPARFLKATVKEGFGDNLFRDWRYDKQGNPIPGFVLNDPRYKDAVVLVAGKNFGSGSSREHAAWAIAGYGFRVVVSSFFADIHKQNELNNFVLPVQVSEPFLQELFASINADPQTEVRVDLPAQTITNLATGHSEKFDINAYKKHCLMEGLDDIDFLVRNQQKTESWEKKTSSTPLLQGGAGVVNSILSLLICAICAATMFLSCSDDDTFTTNRSATLSFSRDSVIMDTVFSNIGSRTYDFWVFNHQDDGLRLKSVRLQYGNQTGFRVNVDGSYLDNTLGSVVTDLEVRRGDSIRVFVELTSPGNGQIDPLQIDDDLVFTLESGVEQKVALRGFVWDALQWHDPVISSDSVIESRKPIVIYGGLRVDSAATLTLRNTTLYFHDKAGIDVYGTLKADSAVLRGDRLDRMFDYLPYDRVSGQWRGVHIYSSSFGNSITSSEIRSAEYGIVCDSAAYSEDQLRLRMERSVIHNCKGPGLKAFNSNIELRWCQFTNTMGDCVALYGGTVVMEHCTLAQFYPFSAERGAALRFANNYDDQIYPLHNLRMTGSIVTGYSDDVVMGEAADDSLTAFNYYFENTLLRTPAIDDSLKFVSIRWETPDDSIQGKQHFRLIDEKNLIYDFHLDSLSTAQGLGCY